MGIKRYCKKIPSQGWKAQYVKLFYEKDKALAIDGKPLPTWDSKILDKFPEGYKWLGAAQERIGHDVSLFPFFIPVPSGFSEKGIKSANVADGKMLYDLPTMNNQGFFDLYTAMELWLEGRDEECAQMLHVPDHEVGHEKKEKLKSKGAP